MSSKDAEHAIFTLLNQRGPGRTICPSEAAKALARAEEDWRSKMEEVHKAVDYLVAAGTIELSWKGQVVPQRRGPYRIARRRVTGNAS